MIGTGIPIYCKKILQYSKKSAIPNALTASHLFLSHPVHCVKIFNICPYRYFSPVAQGEALGYLLPLQERFSGITSHLELQMCDGSDPSPFI
uniref:Uncharacterized protein n=1 Tax=Acanthochromis polyacanthus TaxID=80966 RepID=A0A3Q1GQJ3_9TELE